MSRKILVADDSPTIHKIVGLAFSGEDVTVESALDSDQAIEKLSAGRPDLILAEAQLPKLNGYELCGFVKSKPHLVGIPVILMIGTFESFDEIEALRVQCDAHVAKPFDTRELVALAQSFWVAKPGTVPGKGSDRMNTDSGKQGVSINKASPASTLVSPRTRESFLGDNPMLDILDPVSARPSRGRKTDRPAPPRPAPKPESPSATNPAGSDRAGLLGAIPDSLIDEIVERVVRKMSAEVIREISWEVIPELAEIIIRQYIKEQGLPPKE